MKTSASAAQIAGRGSTDSNRQFTNTHASSDSVIANGPYSVDSRTASAARWSATIRAATSAKNLTLRDPARVLSLIPGSATADIAASLKAL